MLQRCVGTGAILSLFLAAASSAATTENVAVVATPFGEIVWRFFPNEAPGHTAYVQELIKRGFYDGTLLHRVIPHFVVQGGDPSSKNADRGDDGEGEADRTLKAEFSKVLHYRPGTVGMARGDDPDSGSCQFFIALEDIPRLDGNYTIFGEVTSGLEVARRIADLPRDLNDNPLQPVPVTIRLEKRTVPSKIDSLTTATGTGEVLTGPGRRPRYLDAGDVLWSKPELIAGGAPDAPPLRLELTTLEDGRVADVRFPRLDTPDAAAWQRKALGWTLKPVLYDGQPQRARFQIDSDGKNVGSSTGLGAPVEIAAGILPPTSAVRVDLAPGRKKPEAATRLRLIIDAGGQVSNASVQESCGDKALDAAAADAARRLLFAPATRTGGREPEPVAVYLNVTTVFVESPAAEAKR